VPAPSLSHQSSQLQDHNGGFARDFIQAHPSEEGLSPAALDERCRFLSAVAAGGDPPR
jgi:hypothetical protein